MKGKGITNIQVIVVVALIANLTGIVVATQKLFKEKTGRMTCYANMRSIKQAEQIYHAYYNVGEDNIREERVGNVNLRYLVAKDFLPYVPWCPQGGTYKWDSEGELYCTYHGFGEIY